MRLEPGDQPQQHGCEAEVCEARRVNRWPPSRGFPLDCSAAGSPTGAAVIKALSTSSSRLYTLGFSWGYNLTQSSCLAAHYFAGLLKNMFKPFQITDWPPKMLSQTRVTFLNIGMETWLVNYPGTCGAWGFQGAIKARSEAGAWNTAGLCCNSGQLTRA